MRITVAKEELQEAVEYSCDPFLATALKGECVFSYLPPGMYWAIFPALVGSWAHTGLGKESIKTNSPKIPQAVA